LAYCFLAIGPVAQITGQESQSKRVPDVTKELRLSIELKGGPFHLRDIVTLVMKLENIGDSAVGIYKHMGFGPAGFELVISDENGIWVRDQDLVRETFPPFTFAKEDFRILEPKSVIKEEITLDLGDYAFSGPGKYKVAFSYFSPVLAELAPRDLRVFTMDDGLLEAKPIELTLQ